MPKKMEKECSDGIRKPHEQKEYRTYGVNPSKAIILPNKINANESTVPSEKL
jgi:hypothetical protein